MNNNSRVVKKHSYTCPLHFFDAIGFCISEDCQEKNRVLCSSCRVHGYHKFHESVDIDHFFNDICVAST
jgi:hypothetical protein